MENIMKKHKSDNDKQKSLGDFYNTNAHINRNSRKININKISLSELEQYLWGAANILRGPVDKADFKSYIFPLLFFKRISDVYNEEYSSALKESRGDEEYASFPEQHKFLIPEGAHWKDVREKTQNVGQAIQYTFREIEKTNPERLYGIFGDVLWTNKDRLSDELLINLIEHLSTRNLSNSNVPPDVLGQAYEFLIKKFADLSKRKVGSYIIPNKITQMLNGDDKLNKQLLLKFQAGMERLYISPYLKGQCIGIRMFCGIWRNPWEYLVKQNTRKGMDMFDTIAKHIKEA
jgi:hypothetical protein